jgi:hypothetical protein
MKAILKFNLLDHDEQKLHLRCVLSTKMAFVLWEINNNGYKKLENDGESAYNQGILDTLDYLRDLMEEDGIYINDLID